MNYAVYKVLPSSQSYRKQKWLSFLLKKERYKKEQMSRRESIWSLISIGKEGGVDIHHTVFLNRDSDILEATSSMSEEIWQELADHGYDIPEEPPYPGHILHTLNETNNRSLSYYVVQVYPPGSNDIQSLF